RSISSTPSEPPTRITDLNHSTDPPAGSTHPSHRPDSPTGFTDHSFCAVNADKSTPTRRTDVPPSVRPAAGTTGAGCAGTDARFARTRRPAGGFRPAGEGRGRGSVRYAGDSCPEGVAAR